MAIDLPTPTPRLMLSWLVACSAIIAFAAITHVPGGSLLWISIAAVNAVVALINPLVQLWPYYLASIRFLRSARHGD
jgi:hypothetical protein